MTMLVRVVVALSAWAAWAGAVQAEKAALAIEVKQPINALAFSPDGRQVISGTWDKTLPLALWDATSGKLLRSFRGHSAAVAAVAFSPDGRQAISGSDDKTLRLWDVASGRLLRTFTGHSDAVKDAAFSPDGRRVISGSEDNSLRLWDIASGQMLRSFKGHSAWVMSVAFSPDGRQVISGSWDKTLRLWDVSTGQALRSFRGHSDPVSAVAFSPDGRQVISGSYDKTLRLWDVATGQMLRSFTGHAGGIYKSIAFSPDGRTVISGSEDKTLRLWDIASGRMLHRFEGSSGEIYAAAFSPDGRKVISGGIDTILRLWNVPSEQPVASGVAARDNREAERSGVEQEAKSKSPTQAGAADVGDTLQAVLLDENVLEGSKPSLVGRVQWRLETEPGREAPNHLIRGIVDIPERGLRVTLIARRNLDQSLPASHTIDLLFEGGLEADGGIANVPRILVKSTTAAQAVPLQGLVVPVTRGLFLAGLAPGEAERKRNLELLRMDGWFDIPLVYENGRRAILSIQKGAPGKRPAAWETALQQWEAASGQVIASSTPSKDNRDAERARAEREARARADAQAEAEARQRREEAARQEEAETLAKLRQEQEARAEDLRRREEAIQQELTRLQELTRTEAQRRREQEERDRTAAQAAPPTVSETRVALVIGNSAYAAVGTLPNAKRDAQAIAAALRTTGFKSVTVVNDADRAQLVQALYAFSDEAKTADWAMVYYAGHGIEFQGSNYLIPIDARLRADRDVEFEAVPLRQVLATVEDAKKLRLVVLDACRDNPFAERMRRTVATRSITRGLARVEPSGATLVAYAAKDGQVAEDGRGENSPFVLSLVKRLGEPGLEINKLFRLVRNDVLIATGGKQEPFVYGSLPPDDFYFRPPQAD